MENNTNTGSTKKTGGILDKWLTLHALTGIFRMSTQLLAMMILVPIIIGFVGEEKYGVWTLAMAIVGVLVFLEMGLVQSTNRFLSAIDFKTQPQKMREYTCTAFWLTLFSGVLVLLVGLSSSKNIAGLLGVPEEIQAEAGFVITVFVWRFAISIPLRNFVTVLLSQRLMARAHFTQGLSNVIYFFLGLLILNQGFGLEGLAVAYFFAMLIEHFIYMIMAKTVQPYSVYWPSNINTKLIPQILEFSVFAWLGQFVNVALLRLSVLIVQITSGLVATAAFGIVMRLTAISSEFAAQIIVAGGPKIAKLSAGTASDKKDAGWVTLNLARRSVLLSGILAAVAIPLGGLFLDGWVGTELSLLATAPLSILALSSALGAPVQASSNALALSGDHRWTNVVSLISVMFYLPMAYFCGLHWGATGVSAVALMINVFVSVPLFTRRVSKKLDIEYKLWWSMVFRCHVLPFFITLMVASGFAMFIRANIEQGKPWLVASALAGLLSGLIYVLIYFLFSAPSEDKRIANSLLSKFHKKNISIQKQNYDYEVLQLFTEQDWEQIKSEVLEFEDLCKKDCYMCFEYQRAVWRNDATNKAWLLKVCQNGTLLGLSYWNEEYRNKYALKLKVARSMDFNVMQLVPMLTRIGYEDQMAKMLIEARLALSKNNGCDLLGLFKVEQESAKQLVEKLKSEGLAYSDSLFNVCYQIDLSDGIEAYLKTKKRKSLYNIRRSARLLSEHLDAELVLQRLRGDSFTDLEFADNWKQFEALHELTWQRESETLYGEEYAKRMKHFYREATLGWIRKGMLDLVLLKANGQVVSAQLNLIIDDVQWVVLMNYDKKLEKYSPGRVLFYQQLLDSYDLGDRMVILGGEAEQGKKFWSNLQTSTHSLSWPLDSHKALLWSFAKKLTGN